VQHLGALGHSSVAVDLYGGKSATSHEGAMKLMQSAVTKLRREECQMVAIRKQEEKSEGENELPGIVSSY